MLWNGAMTANTPSTIVHDRQGRITSEPIQNVADALFDVARGIQ